LDYLLIHHRQPFVLSVLEMPPYDVVPFWYLAYAITVPKTVFLQPVDFITLFVLRWTLPVEFNMLFYNLYFL
jgi:uncharacterized membrane protein